MEHEMETGSWCVMSCVQGSGFYWLSVENEKMEKKPQSAALLGTSYVLATSKFGVERSRVESTSLQH